MVKFNRRGTPSGAPSPISTEARPSGRTHEGAPGFARDAKSELFLLAVTNMVGERTFYESADQRDDRYERLVREVATADPAWTLGFLGWLRDGASMRSAALVAAAEAVKARLDAGPTGSAAGVPGPPAVRNRQLVDAVLQRADEPGELLAYWTARHGRAIPKPVKRGVADALLRLYTERSLLKYDTSAHSYRFGDVIDLVHPVADAPWRGDLFAHALDRRHQRGNPIPESLAILARNAELRAAAAVDPSALLDRERLRNAGMTWEDALSLAGPRLAKARLWEALVRSMGILALARNLRNFDEAGVSDEIAERVAARFADREQVARSRMFPFRWLAAYRNAPSLRWGQALDRALTASLANVPALSGRTLILVDVSWSMSAPMSGRSGLNRVDAARVFAAAVASRAQSPTLVWFSSDSGRVKVPRGGSLLRLVEAIPEPKDGTEIAAAVRRWYRGHDRVIIVTDEQAGTWHGGDPGRQVPATVPMYTWNVAGYQRGHSRSGERHRHTFGGLTDQAFGMIPLLESGSSGRWPWEPDPV